MLPSVAYCVGVSEAAQEVQLLEDCLHGGDTTLLGTQAHQNNLAARRHRIQGSLQQRAQSIANSTLS